MTRRVRRSSLDVSAGHSGRRRLAWALALFALSLARPGAPPSLEAQSSCGPSINPIVCENLKPGNPESEWDVAGAGDPSIQGFATDISVNRGQTIQFKIDTTATSFDMNIYRIGYYGGMGARLVATIPTASTTETNQPNCLTNAATGLIDCGNWSVSASWAVPADAVSGVYIARPRRLDNGGASHIILIVRDDTGGSDLLFQTSDTTWQAYNNYGGNSLYVGSPAGRAYKVSYNRPFSTRGNSQADSFFNAEYPMVRWLEANGFNVSYFTGVDADRRGAEIREHKAYLSVGHDEYWSGGQRASVEAARAAGVHLAFFSGNEVFWKTRWEASIDGSGATHRTLVTYKETHANAKIDPSPEWTGTWRDPRFSPPANGGRPENALTGTIFTVNCCTYAMQVPAAFAGHRFWRNTTVANLTGSQVATFPNGTLGYEWDEAPVSAATPAGLMRLSSTTITGVDYLQDYGSIYAPGTATHSLTLYRHASGALVFGAGTVQWSWGLDSNHDRGSAAPDVRMEQATVNLFADMGVQPGSLRAGLTTASASTDALAPTSTITLPASGGSVPAGSNVTVQGTASENGGGRLMGVEVSIDNGATWRPASGTSSWTFAFIAPSAGPITIRSRAFDDSGNMETPSAGVTLNIGGGGAGGCPCSIWNNAIVPPRMDADTSAVEVGMKFRSDIDGFITGVRFYKYAQNTGTHVGSLWSLGGTRLANVTFTNETASGWQQAMFASPVAVTANTVYVISYFAPVGRYAVASNFFAGTGVSNAPLHALADGANGPNGVYRYSPTPGAFPTSTFQSENYWVDVVFEANLAPDTTPPTVSNVFPASGATGVAQGANATVTFSEGMDPATITASTLELRGAGNVLVPSAISYDAASRTATIDPSSALALGATYTASVRGGAADPRVKDPSGNALAAPFSWSFTTSATAPPPTSCPCSIWNQSTTPTRMEQDFNAVEIGVRFRANTSGYITGVKFYKYTANTGVHTGNLWTNTGALLARATFTNETGSGWQQVQFASPVAINANTTYVASYHSPIGRYGVTSPFFSAGVTTGPLRALADGEDGANGLYRYTASTAFPTDTFNSENYWVDVVFVETIGPDVTAPLVSVVSPANGEGRVTVSANVAATFNEAMDAASITSATFELRDPNNALVAATVTYDTTTRTATLNPTPTLTYSTTYTARVRGGAADPRAKDTAGNALASNHQWTFTTSTPPPDIGPGGPILVIGTAANPFSTYFAEILRAEGLNAFAVADISTVSASTLNAYDIVILGEMALTDPQVATFTNWVNVGGNLIAMRPDKKLAGLMGLTDAGATLANGYLLVNTAAAPGSGIVNQTMQYHGTADRYVTSGAVAVATLWSTATVSTTNPAVTIRNVGASGGTAVAFTYDLARSVIYTRQGNPLFAGQDRDGLAPIRSNDQFWPDWLDLNKVAIPQADEQQRLLGKIIHHVNADRKPLPRFWFLPKGKKAAIVMTGDDHSAGGAGGTVGRFDNYRASSVAGCSVADWECIRSTSYVYLTSITNAEAISSEADGFEVAAHVNTNCANFTRPSLETTFTTELADFRTSYPGAPAPTTNRTHCLVWSDYDSQPQVEFANGIRLDTTYYYFPASWAATRPGFFTGSGMPMRFATAAGQMLDVYQAATQLNDEAGQAYPATVDTLLDRALGPEGYYGVFTALMHTDNPESTGSDAIVLSAQSRGVPIVSARQMLQWLDGRNGSSFGTITWSGNILSFPIAVASGARNLEAMVPTSFGTSTLTGIQRNGALIPHRVETIKGVDYAFFSALPGSYQAAYGADAAPPVISAVSASPSTNGTAAITWLTNENASSSVAYGTSPASLTSSASDPALVTSHAVLLSGLTPNTTYHYRVTSADAVSNSATSPTAAQAPASFTTPAPALSVADASVNEGNAGTSALIFAVTMTPASQQQVTVSFAASPGTAAAGTDYGAASGTLTFAANETSKTVTVLVNGDTLDEANETVLLTLSAPVNATLARAQATGTITDDDAPPAVSVSDVTVTEGNAGIVNAVFAVTLSTASGQAVTVNYATGGGSATSGADYTNTSGTVTIAAGTTSQTVSVAVTGDTLHELNETFNVTLSAPANATLGDATGAGTIANDDAAPSISIADVGLNEGNSGTTNASFIVGLSAASGQTVSVVYGTANGSATSGSDYTAAAGTLTFAPGVTAGTITVPVLGDTAIEPDETFTVTLSGPGNATIARGVGTGTIRNDEGLPALTIADVTVSEGNAGTVNAVFTVTLSGATPDTVNVDYSTANGTATAGTDYTATSGTLTLAPGITSGSITVVVSGDTATESGETFSVTLANPANATIARATATGTIGNDDGTPGLVAAYGFNEATGATVVDSSGNNLSGTIDGATRTAAGRFGAALTFDGADDLVTVPDAAVLDITRMTLEAWVRPTTLSSWRTVILKESPSGLAYALYAHDNAPNPSGYVNIGGIDRDVQGGTAPPLNVWTHLAVTYDGTTMRLYRNGTQVATRAQTGNILVSANPLQFGGNTPWGEYFAGEIDEIRIYNRALTAAEVTADMNTAVP